MNAILRHQPEDSKCEAAHADFFATVRTAARESDAAVLAAEPALERIAQAIVGRDSGQALRVSSILLLLYAGGAVLADISDLLTLDWSLRQDLCAVLLAFGHGEVGYDYMRTAFEDAGDRNAQWFLGAAPDPIERLREALVFVKPGPLTTTPRTLSERGVAEFVAGLFQGKPVDLVTALKGLDTVRVALVLNLMSDFLAGRFDNNAAELVRAHFSAGGEWHWRESSKKARRL